MNIKPLLLTLALVLAGAALAQDPPKRVHTRPPYSGSRKNQGKAAPPVRPAAGQHKAVHPLKPRADHVTAH